MQGLLHKDAHVEITVLISILSDQEWPTGVDLFCFTYQNDVHLCVERLP